MFKPTSLFSILSETDELLFGPHSDYSLVESKAKALANAKEETVHIIASMQVEPEFDWRTIPTRLVDEFFETMFDSSLSVAENAKALSKHSGMPFANAEKRILEKTNAS